MVQKKGIEYFAFIPLVRFDLQNLAGPVSAFDQLTIFVVTKRLNFSRD